MGLVVSPLRCRLRQGLFVVPHAIFVKELLVHPVVDNEFMRNGFNQCSVSPWANRNPFVSMCHGRIGIDRIDDDHLGLFDTIAFTRARHLPRLTMARTTGHGWVMSKSHIKLCVSNLRNIGRRACAIGHRERRRNLRGRIRTVVLQVAPHEV